MPYRLYANRSISFNISCGAGIMNFRHISDEENNPWSVVFQGWFRFCVRWLRQDPVSPRKRNGKIFEGQSGVVAGVEWSWIYFNITLIFDM